MYRLNPTALYFAGLAVSLVTGCIDASSSDNQPSAPSIETSSKNVVVGTKGDIALLGYSLKAKLPTELSYSRLAVRGSSDTVSMLTERQTDRPAAYTRTAVNANGTIVQAFRNEYHDRIYYRIGRTSNYNDDVAWSPGFFWASSYVPTDTSESESFDVTISDAEQVLVVWTQANNSVLCYSLGVTVPWGDSTIISWNQFEIPVYFAGGKIYNPRVAFAGAAGDLVYMVYQPDTYTERKIGFGVNSGQSVSWYLSNPTTLRNRWANDSAYDITADRNYNFSIAWTTETSSRDTAYLYFQNGYLTGSSRGAGLVLLPQILLTSINASGGAFKDRLDYTNPDLGRSSDGTRLMVAFGQRVQGGAVWRSDYQNVYVLAATLAEDGSVLSKKVNDVAGAQGKSDWTGVWMAY